MFPRLSARRRCALASLSRVATRSPAVSVVAVIVCPSPQKHPTQRSALSTSRPPSCIASFIIYRYSRTRLITTQPSTTPRRRIGCRGPDSRSLRIAAVATRPLPESAAIRSQRASPALAPQAQGVPMRRRSEGRGSNGTTEGNHGAPPPWWQDSHDAPQSASTAAQTPTASPDVRTRATAIETLGLHSKGTDTEPESLYRESDQQRLLTHDVSGYGVQQPTLLPRG